MRWWVTSRAGWIGVVALLAMTGCELINPDEQVPAYLRIERFQFVPGVAGAPATSQISDAWVYANDQLLGVFELPVTVPVLASGTVKITLKPGVYADGQRGVRFAYPFYKTFSTTEVLTAGQTLRLTPTTGFDGAEVHAFDEVKEDFETDNVGDRAFTLDPAHYRLLSNVRTDLPGIALNIPASFGGVGVVQGKPDTTQLFLLRSTFYNVLPGRGAAVYAELDYRSSMPFRVGVESSLSVGGIVTRSADLTVFPKQEWTKLYVNLTDEISYVNNPSAKFRLIIEGQPTGATGQYLALDNVRLVRFK